MIIKCPRCEHFFTPTTPVNNNVRIRAWSLTVEDLAGFDNMPAEQIHNVIRAMFPGQQVYTHVDVFSPTEELLFRVKL